MSPGDDRVKIGQENSIGSDLAFLHPFKQLARKVGATYLEYHVEDVVR